MCNAVSIITRIPPYSVPKTFPTQIGRYQKTIDRFLSSIKKATAAFQSGAGDHQAGVSHKRKHTPLFAPCTVTGCDAINVKIYHVKYLHNFLSVIGAIIIRQTPASNQTKEGRGGYKLISGIPAIRKIMTTKGIR
jgi:hypothetical protein|uniref:Uncharacterized protein n=1 Tax=Picea glauca TaxID=3330 RepID=A0A101M140_PICGL|nr:hypothetical protein ABT39_MTgene4296 [Picea glauca]